MVKIRPGKFSAPQKGRRNIAVARKKNQEHIKLGLHASQSDYEERTARMRDLHQPWKYPDICKFSNEAARKLLLEYGVLKQKGEKICCWQCSAQMTLASSSSSGGGSSADVLECSNCRTSGRHKLQLKHASLSYSPFWGTKCAGHDVHFDLFLRTAFLHAVRTPVDLMQQLVPDKDKPLNWKPIHNWTQHMNFCLAFQVG